MIDKHPIILVDDDPDDRQIFQEGFEEAGCKERFLQFESGKGFLDYMKEASPEDDPLMILLDLNMPVIDGRQILETLKTSAKWKHIPIVVFTTSTQEKDRREAYELGANCFVSKPAAYQELLEIAKAIVQLWCVHHQ